ncbi:UTP--glucose-1-phosphate uridylyltransferase [Raineyella antarctica]|uniref:UTP--glucose-1-phosphate uridylyltransferase n=1 Tax=Raineyella antarctica TaxID=1577474 RepID=A0A1G6HKX5_9ACTN|nr:UTP--glucose-1-phosphate uridylyltransferase [Raineyella antarctica]SDB94555.1 UTP--glucose-1-phosphate uridylyltransferase [Raineyella antarctica]
MSDTRRRLALAKMREAGVGTAAIEVFDQLYTQLEGGAAGLIAEDTISPLIAPPMLDEVDVDDRAGREALARTAVIKLNGGLGTSMGLDRAKNLLEVRDGLTFLDIIVRQVLSARQTYGVQLPLLFMNSFRTHDDTLAALADYPDLPVGDLPLCFLQNQEPKLGADDLAPVRWPADPGLEWCPPGHGDVYTALYGSGILDALIERGFRYASLSNGDNLGASPDARVAGWFAATGAPYAAEVCRRTANDRKGGHLAIRRSDGQLILRDTAQTPADEMHYFTDEHRHPFFHTNNLWVDLAALNSLMDERGGVLGLPLIRNEKTVDPSDPTSPKVIQLETAMGAAIEVFPRATAIGVGRDRFLPVKTTNELLLLRSDLYELDDRARLVAQAPTPSIALDGNFKLVGDFSRRIPHPLGLRRTTSLTVSGDVSFGKGVQIVGSVEITSDQPTSMPDGTVLEG